MISVTELDTFISVKVLLKDSAQKYFLKLLIKTLEEMKKVSLNEKDLNSSEFNHYYSLLKNLKFKLENFKFLSEINNFKINYNEINENYLVNSDIILSLDLKLLLNYSISFKFKVNLDFTDNISYISITDINMFYSFCKIKNLIDDNLEGYLEKLFSHTKSFYNYSQIKNGTNSDEDLEAITQPLIYHKQRYIELPQQDLNLEGLIQKSSS